jgi:uncharacterized membrane protein YgcG
MSRRTSGPGRHRETRVPLSLAGRITVAGLLVGTAGFAAATWPSAAVADAPFATGWWNAVSGNGQAAPSPTTPAGGLHIAVQPGQITAFGAVLYALPDGAAGTLELKISDSAATPVIDPNAPGSTAPAMGFQACPTKDTSWKPGDDQPIDTAPGYDCTVRSFVGSLSADGKTLTFLVDSSGQSTPGLLSLAIVPVTTTGAPGVGTTLPVDATQPYSADIDKPEATSLTITSTPPVPVFNGGGGNTGGGTGGSTGGSTGSSNGGSTSTGGSSVVPPSFSGTDTGTTTTDSGAPPVVAPTTPTSNAAPVAAVVPTKSDTAHNAALALLVLLGIAMAATSNGQLQRKPRLLGGAARHAAAYPAEPATAAVPLAAAYGNRGLGRFAKPRADAPRPLT